MKKILSVVAIMIILTSSGFSATSGKWGLSVHNIISSNYMNDITQGNPACNMAVPCVQYNMTKDDAIDIGYWSEAEGSSTFVTKFLEFCHYFGHENLSTHIGLSYSMLDSMEQDRSIVYSNISLLFGTAVNISEGLSLEFDFRPLTSSTRQTLKADDPDEKRADYTNATFIGILPSFNLRWVF